ncbi:hypothetical protein JMJ35_002894 [Cladonia borealis]|uniref:Actin interacting protein 3 C-terminal domain-containing protein n=1 Tax=Cladonia borealis TaxID=184061 RepID=A0AA39R3M6_9LECA|nr:hypothetical protein JMJ35_002894 [Cladonia borealis]
MQAPPTSQRSSQKRSPAVEPPAPPQPPATSTSSAQAPAGQRTSSGSSRSSTYRRQNPSQQLSQIEKSVTHLLIATKQLLETLTQWSRHTATEGEVSDVYVRLGYEFNIACRAFNGIGVDTTDLGPVPELLRNILEETLSQEASPASLDRFLPKIRDIIITLLHGLKRKQQRLRAKNVKESGPSPSTSSNSLNTGLTQMLEDVPARRSGGRGSERRTGSGSTPAGEYTTTDSANGDEQGLPPRFSSSQPTRHNSGGTMADASNRGSNRESHRPFPGSLSDSSLSSSTSLSNSALSISPSDGGIQQFQQVPTIQRPLSQRGDNFTSMQPPPPPPPKQQDALAALQRGGDLERRASRRYSAYQISKHLGASPNGVPMLPPTQNGPIPNRGRDVRESMNAVRTRGSGMLSRQRSNHTAEASPARNNRISEESVQSNEARGTEGSAVLQINDGPVSKASSEILADRDSDFEHPRMGATLTSPVNGLEAYNPTVLDDVEPSKHLQHEQADQRSISPQSQEGQTTQQFVPEQSPQPGKELTLFLQYKSKIKKFVLPEGSNDLTIARLQLAFIEKFAWNTHSNGNDLPEIYIQDPVSGVRHELEDLRDVKDRSVLVLNIEVLDEVKKHIDEGLGGLRKIVEGVRSAVDGQQTILQRVTERQQDASREMARLSVTPKVTSPHFLAFEKPKVNGATPSASSKGLKHPTGHVASIQDLRQDLAVVRQTFSTLVSDMNTSMNTVQNNASLIKTMAVEGMVPNLDASTGRAYVNNGKKSLGEDSEKIVQRVDDLQDVVEDLRKDVVVRGVRPLPRQLETVNKNISSATADLKKMQEFLRREKPIWSKIWEKELSLVCDDRDLLTMQEELAADLEDDLEKATQTFALVEQATKQQNLQSQQGTGVVLRSTSKALVGKATDQDIDPMKAKDGVLGEVRALRPNHETRLEAIERAEKARQRELETRREGEFTKEVAQFVEEGRLKKSGGVEEAERLRKARDEKNMREAWEKQQERAASKGKQAETDTSALGESEAPPADEQPQGQSNESAEVEDVPDMQDQAKPIEGDSPSKRTSWLPAIFSS